SPTCLATSPEARPSSPTSDQVIASSPTKLLEPRDLLPPPNSGTVPLVQEVQDGQSPPLLQQLPAHLPRPRGRRFLGIPGRFLGVFVGMGLVGAVGYYGVLPAWSVSSRSDKPLVSIAKRATLSITVSERGSVESQVTVDGICELSGSQNKISHLIPEGTKVKK